MIKLVEISAEDFFEAKKREIRSTLEREMHRRDRKLDGKDLWLKLAVTAACVIIAHESRVNCGVTLTPEEVAGYERARREAQNAAAELGIPPYPPPALVHEMN